MAQAPQRRSFWTSLTGMITALAALITAVGTLLGILAATRVWPFTDSDKGPIVIASSQPPAEIVGAARSISGSWRSTDTDGSSQSLEITQPPGRGADIYSFNYHDTASAACQGVPLDIAGTGTFSDQTLKVRFTFVCPGSPDPLGPYDSWYRYNSASDTITDNWGVVWRRV